LVAKEKPKPKAKGVSKETGVDLTFLSTLFLFLTRFDDFILGIGYAALGIMLLNTSGSIIIPSYEYLDYFLVGVLVFLGIIIAMDVFLPDVKAKFRTTVLYILLVDGSLATFGYRFEIMYNITWVKSQMLSAATILLVASIALILAIARRVSNVGKLAKEAQRVLTFQQQAYEDISSANVPEKIKDLLLKVYYENQAFLSSVFSSILEPVGEDETNKQLMTALLIALVTALIQYGLSYYGLEYVTAVGYEIGILFVILIGVWFWTKKRLEELEKFREQVKLAKKVAEEL